MNRYPVVIVKETRSENIKGLSAGKSRVDDTFIIRIHKLGFRKACVTFLSKNEALTLVHSIIVAYERDKKCLKSS